MLPWQRPKGPRVDPESRSLDSHSWAPPHVRISDAPHPKKYLPILQTGNKSYTNIAFGDMSMKDRH